MSRWRRGEADVERLISGEHLQPFCGAAADGEPGLERARQTLASAETLLNHDPVNAFVLAYDATRHACTALLAHQGLRPLAARGSHLPVERAVRAQFGTEFEVYSRLRRRRNEVEYPQRPGRAVAPAEAADALRAARRIIDAATRILPHLALFDVHASNR